MLKRFRERFGGGKGGGEGGGGPGGPAAIFGGFLLIGIIIIALWLASGFYIVDEREQGVVLRFGAFSRVTQPGLRWHMPRPIEQVETINVTEIREASDRSVMLTEDENIVEIELRVQYRLSAVQDYLFNVRNPDDALRQATKSALREVVGQNTLDFALVEGREQVANLTRENLQRILDNYQTGLFITNVNLTDARAPAQVQDAFLDAIKAREDQVRLINEAEAYSNDRLPRARGDAARLVEQAQGYRDRVIARAEGDASRFSQLLGEVQRAPMVTRERLYLDAMTDVMAASSKVLVDIEGSGSLMMLPLQEMLRNVGAAAVAGSDSASGRAPLFDRALPSEGTTEPSRSRDRGRR